MATAAIPHYRFCSTVSSAAPPSLPIRKPSPPRQNLLKPTVVTPIAVSAVAVAAAISAASAFPAAAAAASAVVPSQVVVPFLGLPEPSNALSLPTWAVHVSSVAEWATAMVLVWQYGEESELESWKGLSWGMVPPLGGALCACTWHFFYNSESLEILVAIQAALTVLGNLTMCIAAYRIYKSCQASTESP